MGISDEELMDENGEWLVDFEEKQMEALDSKMSLAGYVQSVDLLKYKINLVLRIIIIYFALASVFL